jgi:glycosyltransferase involved in cell wall biosynthesis
MRIAVISDVAYPWVIGGGQKRYYEIFRRLAKKHEVYFYTMFYKGMPSREFNYEGIRVHCVCDAPVNLYVGKRRKIMPALRFSISLYGSLMKEKFDLIESNEFPFLPCFTAKIAARMQGIPLFITWHEVWGDYWNKYLGSLGVVGRIVEKLTSKLPERIISVSSSTSEKLKKEIGVGGNVITLNNGIDLRQINKVKARKDRHKVIFVGRLIPEKNADLLIKNLPEGFKLTIIGEGPERENLQGLAKKLDKRVEFKFFISSHEKFIKEIKSSSLLVNLSEREGFSITALEAIACDTPVLTLRNSLPKEIEELCYPTDRSTVKKKIMKYANSKPRKRDIERFDWNRIAKRVEEEYKRVVG